MSKFEIFYPIIASVSILVMYSFRGKKFSSKIILHNLSV